MPTHDAVVVLLTLNAASVIGETVAQAKKVAPWVFVVDSGSTDATVEILQAAGCEVVNHPFVNYSEQRNWAIAQIGDRATWQLHLDADEVLDDEAVREIAGIVTCGKVDHDAYLLRRRDYFMGRMLRFSGVNPWHLRLFRAGHGKCEARLYDQHFISDRPAGRLAGFMHDKNSTTLSDWTGRHNRWSDLEARQSAIGADAEVGDVLQARLFGDARERTRYVKKLYYRLPIGARALVYFFYRYILRLGFLDGVVGFYFAFFQAFWFRMLVDAKVYEQRGVAVQPAQR